MSFLLLKCFLLFWVIVYLSINAKERHLQEFSAELSDIQNQFLASNSFLQHFMLAGYQQTTFYQTKKQVDIDTFIKSRQKDLHKIKDLQQEANKFNLQLSGSLDSLYRLDSKLIVTAKRFKEAYYVKGCK